MQLRAGWLQASPAGRRWPPTSATDIFVPFRSSEANRLSFVMFTTSQSSFRQNSPAHRAGLSERHSQLAICRQNHYAVPCPCCSNKPFATPSLYSPPPPFCGDEGTRTPDLRLAKASLSQLSYIPVLRLRSGGAPLRMISGPLWTRTTDLPLIRGML